MRLVLIGYWAGPDTSGDWPSPADFIDPAWDADDRSLIIDYLRQGQVARAYMGWSRCRLCGEANGDLELTDGTYVWPSGLVHYVEDHDVRLQQPFVAHAGARIDSIEQAERDEEWWASARPEPPTATAAETAALSSGVELDDFSLSTFAAGAVRVPRGLAGREHVLRVVDELGQELADGSAERWENPTLERFLDAFGALLGTIEPAYRNAGRPVPLDPWVLVADALRGAREHV